MSTTKLLYWAGGLSIATSVVHGSLTSEHFDESTAQGAFFVLAALCQGLYGFLILSSHAINGSPLNERWPPRTLRAFYLAGMVGNAALIVAYVASRTVGFFGVKEAWEGLGIFTKLLELATVVVLSILLARMGDTADPSGTAKPA